MRNFLAGMFVVIVMVALFHLSTGAMDINVSLKISSNNQVQMIEAASNINK